MDSEKMEAKAILGFSGWLVRLEKKKIEVSLWIYLIQVMYQ